MLKKTHIPLDGLEIHMRSCRDPRGVLTFAEEMKDFPFELKRMFWITDVPSSVKRGGHSHSSCMQIACCLHGRFRLVLDNGKDRREYVLDSPTYAVIIPADVWCSLEDFSDDCIVLVGASEEYSPAGYTWNYDDFVKSFE